MRFEAATDCACDVVEAVNFGDRIGFDKAEMIVLHYTGMETGKAALDWLVCEESQVSCHYLVEEDGHVIQMVCENKRAWHAGKSCWKGCEDINSKSIGIEIVNPGHDQGYPCFPDAQIDAVITLCRDIVARQKILSTEIVAHSDISPGRKIDPGEKFPWELFFHNGLGHWVEPQEISNGELLDIGSSGDAVSKYTADLAKFGYCIEIKDEFDGQLKTLTNAFQRHYRPEKIDGIADISTRRTLEKLLELV